MDRKAVKYKVWIHLEGLNKDGDCVEGDDWHEPREAGCFRSLEIAESFRNMLLDACVPAMGE